MPYNCGMAQISAQLTVLLPFALPAPEFAHELARSLNAPALAALLSRTSSHRVVPHAHNARALPHEVWLARELGLEQFGQPAFAAAAMRGFGLDPADGTWFIIQPSHIEISRSHLMMPDLRHLSLADAESRALFDAARPYVEELGHTLAYGDATTWFMRADQWGGLDTATPDTAAGMNLTDFMPSGAQALAYRKLQNEIQMLWYTHAVNAERESRRQPPINAFWLWSGATTTQQSAKTTPVIPAHAGTHAEPPQSKTQHPANTTTVIPAHAGTHAEPPQSKTQHPAKTTSVIPAHAGTHTEPPQSNTHHPANTTTVIPAHAGTHTEPPQSGNQSRVATFETPSWLTALGTASLTSPRDALGASDSQLLICGNLASSAIAADWSAWLHEMQRLETDLFAPSLEALTQGRIKQLKLVLSHRTAHAEFTTTAMAQRKFWRRPTLERLT
jgi:hypothetical protein